MFIFVRINWCSSRYIYIYDNNCYINVFVYLFNIVIILVIITDNAVFFPEFKEGRKKENKDDNKKECIHDTDSSSATTPNSMKSDETTDEELNDNDNIFKPLVHTDSSDFEWSDSDF